MGLFTWLFGGAAARIDDGEPDAAEMMPGIGLDDDPFPSADPFEDTTQMVDPAFSYMPENIFHDSCIDPTSSIDVGGCSIGCGIGCGLFD